MPRRHPLLSALLVAGALAALSVGCGSSDGGSDYGSRDSAEEPPTATATTPEAPPGASARTCEGTVVGAEELRVTGIGCDVGLQVAAAWVAKRSCSGPAGGSRFSCSVFDGYRCLGTSAERGIAVSCAHPGASVAFIAKLRATEPRYLE
jgi:hypothetical protein